MLSDILAGEGVDFADKKLTTGEAFGERALLTGYTRSATATVVSPQATLLVLGVERFQATLGPLSSLMDKMHVKNVLLGLFSSIKLEQFEVAAVMATVQVKSFKAGDSIVQNPEDPCLYVVNSGTVEISSSFRRYAGSSTGPAGDYSSSSSSSQRGADGGPILLGKGNFFGADAFMKPTVHHAAEAEAEEGGKASKPPPEGWKGSPKTSWSTASNRTRTSP